MKIGIMQPYFFPYIGYFSLINYVDEFIFFDTPQYISHGWVNRNRILRQDGKPGYITVPIQKAPQNTAIKDIRISSDNKWKDKIYGQLTVYKRKAPYYKDVLCFLHNILDKDYNSSLVNLNIETIKAVCNYIGLEKTFFKYSQMDIKVSNVKQPDEWALKITKALSGDVYVNLPGGQTFFDRKKYEKYDVKLEFLQSNLPIYIQKIGCFEEGLSIIDVMMFCEKREIYDMLMNFTII